MNLASNNISRICGSSIFPGDNDDPFKIIRIRRGKIISQWQRDYDGDPATSWDNIFENALTDFESYADDPASAVYDEDATLCDKFDSGEYDEYTMYNEFMNFIAWGDLGNYDE